MVPLVCRSALWARLSSDKIKDFTKIGALPNGLDFVQDGDLETIATPTDFMGLNYYSRNIYRANDPGNDPQTIFPQPKMPEHWTEMNWEIYPDGLTGILARVYFNYQPRKLYIT